MSMETIYLGIVIFLFVLAIFDLVVGVSNDAVNFLQSAVGAKAASFKTILFIAGIGVFIGAALSNGMMDIARHGIYQPEHFYFAEIMCILLAVMLTDVVLLDVFNTMGMPTSTTVSLVFELLGGTFALSLIKVRNSDTLGLGDLINTDKALSVIMAIFVSVAIAFFFGMLVQWLARVIFTFNYTKKMKYSIALFGGVAATAIIYFMLIKGLKDSSFMTPENKQWIQDNTWMLISVFFVFFTILMQILHWLKINVFKVVVLMGTFALALAFAGNDLVNFIGVPLAGFSSFMDFTANGNGNPDGFLMTSLLGPAKTPWYFLQESTRGNQNFRRPLPSGRRRRNLRKHPDSPYNRPFQHDTCQRHLTHHPGQHQEMAGHPLPKRRSDHRRRRCFRPRPRLREPCPCRPAHRTGNFAETPAVHHLRHFHGSHGYFARRPCLGT